MAQDKSVKKLLGVCGAVVYCLMSVKVILFHPDLLVTTVVPLTGGIILSYFGFKGWFDKKGKG